MVHCVTLLANERSRISSWITRVAEPLNVALDRVLGRENRVPTPERPTDPGRRRRTRSAFDMRQVRQLKLFEGHGDLLALEPY